jgi:hypothetical protein
MPPPESGYFAGKASIAVCTESRCWRATTTCSRSTASSALIRCSRAGCCRDHFVGRVEKDNSSLTARSRTDVVLGSAHGILRTLGTVCDKSGRCAPTDHRVRHGDRQRVLFRNPTSFSSSLYWSSVLHQLREWDLDEQCQRQTTDGHSGSLRVWTPISAWARPARHCGSLVRWPLSFTALLGEFASRAAATVVVTLLFVVTCLWRHPPNKALPVSVRHGIHHRFRPPPAVGTLPVLPIPHLRQCRMCWWLDRFWSVCLWWSCCRFL